MSQLHHAAVYRHNRHLERRTTGGFVATLLVVPFLVVLMAVPGVVLGAILGALGLKLGKRVAPLLDRHTRAEFTIARHPTA